jgi:Protein of unknown function (DUF3108)
MSELPPGGFFRRVRERGTPAHRARSVGRPCGTFRWGRWLVALLCLLPPLNSPNAGAAVEPFTAVYTIRLGPMDIGEARRVLRQEGADRFVFQSLSRAQGIASYLVRDRILEQSRWEYGPSGHIRPLEYVYRRTGGSRERDIRVAFDWKAHLARISAGSENWRVNIPEGTLDPLLFQIALEQDLRQGPVNGGTELSYSVLDAAKHRLRTYRIGVGKAVDVATPLAKYAAVELRRLDESGGRRLVTWCAPALGYLPVRIDYTEKDGRTYRSLLRSLDWGNTTGAARHF